MQLELRFFASFREAAGSKTVEWETRDGLTIGELMQDLTDEYGMDLFEEDGEIRDFITVMRNGQDITHIDGLETTLSDGDRISVFPPVAGGGADQQQ
ncbi:MAG: MoaD/ThiS family protein [Natronomonas sp.]